MKKNETFCEKKLGAAPPGPSAVYYIYYTVIRNTTLYIIFCGFDKDFFFPVPSAVKEKGSYIHIYKNTSIQTKYSSSGIGAKQKKNKKCACKMKCRQPTKNRANSITQSDCVDCFKKNIIYTYNKKKRQVRVRSSIL